MARGKISQAEGKMTSFEKAREAEKQHEVAKKYAIAEQAEELERIKKQAQESADLRAKSDLEKEKARNDVLKRQKKEREEFLKKELSPDEMAHYQRLIAMCNGSSRFQPDTTSMRTLSDYRVRLKNNGVKKPD